MRILIDALAATEFAGGMTLHAREIILTWEEAFPQDEIFALTGPSLTKYLKNRSKVNVINWKNESILQRAPGQILGSYLVARKVKADFVVSLSPIVSPLISSRKSASFQHDWRHLKNPGEFSRINKIYRKLWEISAKTAGINFCISQKAMEETISIAPKSYSVVVENGRDHARRWENDVQPIIEVPYVITFGHHNNKRPELTMEAFASISKQHDFYKLVILGARGSYADDLRKLAEELHIASKVHFPGFVSDSEYQNLIKNSSVLVMASSDEGFGLPAAEAEYFGIPTVVTEDSGMQTIFDDLYVAQPEPTSLSLKLEEAISKTKTIDKSTEVTRQWTWLDAVASIRNFITQKAI